MTTNPPSEDPRSDDPSGDIHTCYNCFAEFVWEPTIHDGEAFCCSGCVEGGPCICTYDGPPKPVEVETVPTAVVSEVDLDIDDEVEIDSRREVLLEAIGELPDQLQQIARIRVVSDTPIGEIARDLDMTAAEADGVLASAQAVIRRVLGPDFVIE